MRLILPLWKIRATVMRRWFGNSATVDLLQECIPRYKILFTGWQRNLNTIKNKRKPRFIDWHSFVFGHVYILLPPSTADFVTRDAFLRKEVHCRSELYH